MAATTSGSGGDTLKLKLSEEGKRTIEKMQKVNATPELRKGLREATQPMQPAIRKVARALPSSRTKKTAKESGGSLRTAVANAVTRKVKVNKNGAMVVICVVPKGGKSNLARCVEGAIPWEHPTYGHDPKVSQKPEPFFYRTIEELAPSAYRRIENILTDIEKKM